MGASALAGIFIAVLFVVWALFLGGRFGQNYDGGLLSAGVAIFVISFLLASCFSGIAFLYCNYSNDDSKHQHQSQKDQGQMNHTCLRLRLS